MFRKVLVTGGMALLVVSTLLGVQARAQEGAPVPTTPTTEFTADATTTSTSQPLTTVQRTTTGMAGTGPHDYVAWVSLAGVLSIAVGISMRGRRAEGNHYWR